MENSTSILRSMSKLSYSWENCENKQKKKQNKRSHRYEIWIFPTERENSPVQQAFARNYIKGVKLFKVDILVYYDLHNAVYNLSK